MRIIWTRSRLPVSVLIRLVTGEDCSHLALVFESRDGGIMFESNLLGTHPKFFKTAQKHMEVVHEMVLPWSVAQEDSAWDLMVDRFDGKPYDWRGVLYLGWRKLLFRLFRRPIPAVNAWARQDAYFCDELYAILEATGAENLDVAHGMKSPHDVWRELNRAVLEPPVQAG